MSPKRKYRVFCKHQFNPGLVYFNGEVFVADCTLCHNTYAVGADRKLHGKPLNSATNKPTDSTSSQKQSEDQ